MKVIAHPCTILYCSVEEGLACILPSIVKGGVGCNQSLTLKPSYTVV